MKVALALVLLSVYTIIEFIGYMPQIIKLLKTKSAKDLSLTSWFLWVIAALCYLTYVLMESPEAGVIFIAVFNLTFISIVFLLTLFYQKRTRNKKRN